MPLPFLPTHHHCVLDLEGFSRGPRWACWHYCHPELLEKVENWPWNCLGISC